MLGEKSLQPLKSFTLLLRIKPKALHLLEYSVTELHSKLVRVYTYTRKYTHNTRTHTYECIYILSIFYFFETGSLFVVQAVPEL